MGKDHPSTAQAYYDLGAFLFTRDKYKEAEQALQCARKILINVFGRESYNLIAVYNALSVVYEKLGQEQEAKAYSAQFMKLYKQQMDKQKDQSESAPQS